MGIDLQILRPAVVSGRLMDGPTYVTTKFDVFYGLAKFFFSRKEKIGDSKFRIKVNTKGTLNIVPADYVAKVIAKAIHMDNIKQLNIVSSKPPKHTQYYGKILDELGITNYEFIDEMPADQSVWETLYYKSVGRVFEPYLCGKNLQFDTSILDNQFSELQFNDINDEFGNLIKYAIDKKFEENTPVVQKEDHAKLVQLPPSFEKYKIQKQA